MKTFDGQNPWIIVGIEGGLYTGYTTSEPLNQHLSVLLIDWDAFSTKEEDLDDIQERLEDILPQLRRIVPPGNARKLFRHGLVEDYRQERPLWDKHET
jgi:hypothetical protein